MVEVTCISVWGIAVLCLALSTSGSVVDALGYHLIHVNNQRWTPCHVWEMPGDAGSLLDSDFEVGAMLGSHCLTDAGLGG